MITVKQNKTNALGHTEVINKAIAATCTKSGLTEGKHCSVCNTILAKQTVVNALGHTEGKWVTDKEAGVTEDGSKHQVCSACGETVKTEIIHATGSVGLSYKLDNNTNTYTVSGVGTCTDACIVIPRFHNNISVTGIGQDAFSNNTIITSIAIPDTITNIGMRAFYGCKNLTEVHISDIASWCKISFATDRGLSDSGYGWYANPLVYAHNLYINGNLITELIIPKGVEEISTYAFHFADCITSVYIPGSVKSISSCAFGYCDNLTTVIIDDGVKSLGMEVFSYCANLTSITIPDSIESISANVFVQCTKLDNITIPGSILRITAGTFENCRALANITISHGVTDISNSAFYGCRSLTSITIPSSVTNIGDSAFSGCRDLTTFKYDGTIAEWEAITKGRKWNLNSPFTVVHCTDGDVAVE